MATAYDFVAANKRRSVFLVAIFVVLVVALGWVIGQWLNYGYGGVVLAVLLAIGMTLGGYYSGDRIALTLAQAQGPIKETDAPELYHLVENLCLSVGLPKPQVYLLPEDGINAFATGRDPQHASLAVTAGALQKLDRTELEGVIAHELSHIQNYDVRFMTLVAVLVGVIILLSDFFSRSWWLGGGRRRSGNNDNNPVQAGLMIVGLILLIFAPLFAQLIKLAISRKREFMADASGALITRYPAGLASALEKIAADGGRPLQHAATATAHMYIANPFGAGRGLANLFNTHPPIAERIAALRRMDHS
jgi:heat shock protein HtpX